MPEMKHNFTKGRMNKDLDERLVPKGEYRDALNIEVSTSEGSNMGALQTTLGNLVVSEPNNGVITFTGDQPSVVGKIEDGKNNRIIYFVNKPVDEAGKGEDLIISYDVKSGVSEVVFRDIWQFEATVSQATNNSAFFYVYDTHGVKPNMTIQNVTSPMPVSTIWPFQAQVQTVSQANKVTLKSNDATNSWALNDVIRFNSRRILNFKTRSEDNNLITAINIVDDMLFWTDNDDEPKKINISRSILGSQNFPGTPTAITGEFLPTKLIVNGGNTMTSSLGTIYDKGYVEHSHVTVIRQAPTLRPKIHVAKTKRNVTYDSASDSFTSAIVSASTLPINFYDSAGDILTSGDTITLSISNNAVLDYVPGDIVVLNLTDLNFDEGVQEFAIMATVLTTTITQSGLQDIELQIDTIDEDIENVDEVWQITLKQEKPLFEFKFPRFATRYKYEDGEYSAFSPWSEVAFIPTEFDYLPKKGYNLGMVNQTRWLAIRDFIPYNLPLDVVEVDILYKEENSPNIYTVKSIKGPKLNPSEDPDEEWESRAFINGNLTTVGNTGFFVLEKDLIHATLPSNQLLRPYDNVPRQAKAQEVSANRVIYGNYLQQYNLLKGGGGDYNPDMEVMIVDRINTYDTINYKPGIQQGTLQSASTSSTTITITVAQAANVRVGSRIYCSGLTTVAYVTAVNTANGQITLSKAVTIANGATVNFNENTTKISTVVKQPEKSIKSMRTYQMGIIYTDEFGREIPVQANDSGTFTVDKNRANKYNQIKVRLQTGPPVWAKHFRYYVKETSNEYYNLAMDRWYDAQDGNIWLSFPSAERNKVDEETFLILKKGHDTDQFVKERARYKILAISNDAPDFIKEEKTYYESRALTFEQNGLIKKGTDYFAIDKQDITKSAIDQAVTDIQAGRGEFEVRVTVGNKKSAWYNLSTVTVHEQNNDYKRFIVDRPFEDDTAFSLNTAGNAHVSGTRIEIQQTIRKNKPEFDGRFFVKILRDTIAEKYIYRARQAEAVEYVVTHSRRHLTLCWTGDEKKSFWKDDPVGNFSWSSMINQQQNGATDYTGWFIDYAVGAYQGQDSGTIRYDQGIGFYKPTANTNANGSFLQFSYSHLNEHTRDLDAANHQSEIDFRTALESPGTLIRWSSDPDQVIYEIVSSFGYPATNNSGNRYYDAARKELPGKKVDYDFTTRVYNYDNSSNKAANKRFRFNLHIQTIEQTTPTGKVIPRGLPVGLDDSWDGTGNISNPQLSGSWHPLDVGALNGTSVNGYGGTTAKGHPHFGLGGNSGQTPNTSSVRYSNREINFASSSNHQNNSTGVSRHEGTIVGGVELPVVKYNKTTLVTGNYHHKPDKSEIRATAQFLEIIEPIEEARKSYTSTNPGIWETEPKQDVGLDIYYEASRSLRNEAYGSDIERGDEHGIDDYGNIVYHWLKYYNCFSFANGVESNRIRDDYNALQITKGVKASTTLAEQYKEERRTNGLIFSGIYNSTSGVNNLNQFLQAEAITKDLNPTHGSIQKLFSRDTDLLALCEDKVLKILANKDALFNADGNTNVTSNAAVLGQAVPFVGDFGISLNPESFASDEFRCYFTDRQRGAVLRLSRDGITNIAEHGMEDYFADNLTFARVAIGSFDKVKKTYNLTLKDYGFANGGLAADAVDNTSSFSEAVKGWTSFKSFIQECGGVSLNNSYYTFNNGNMWIHHEIFGGSAPKHNNFYGTQYDSSVTFILNDEPSSVKSFNTLNYEGTQAKITENDSDDEYYNNNPKDGWYCSSITTDLQEGKQLEFKDKEGKWFNTIHGLATSLSNLDSKEFSVQGIGNASTITGGNPTPTLFDMNTTGSFGTCTIACGSPVNAQGAAGQYRFSMDLGNTAGVAIIKFEVGAANITQALGDELITTFNGVSKNTYSTPVGGWQEGLIGASKSRNENGCFGWATVDTTGSTQKVLGCSQTNVHTMDIYDYDVSAGAFTNTNNTTTIPLYAANNESRANLGALGPYGTATKGTQTINNDSNASRNAYTYISIPTGYSGSTIADFVVNAPMNGTWWGIDIACPTNLTAIGQSSAVLTAGQTHSQICSSSPTMNQTYYHIPVNASQFPTPPAGKPMVNDWIFTDDKGLTPLPAGLYKLQDLQGNQYAATVGITNNRNEAIPGIIGSITPC